MKKSLAILLTICMLLTMMPVAASAAEVESGTCGKDLTWVLTEDGTLTISGTGEMTSAPWRYDEYASLEIKRVIIEEGVTAICANAFRDYGSLTSVTFPAAIQSLSVHSASNVADLSDTLTSIGNYAFYNCAGLTEIVLPSSVQSIGVSAFYNCTGLTDIMFTGDAPTFGNSCFWQVDATVWFPAGNETWSGDAFDHHGEKNIVWASYDPEVLEPKQGTWGGNISWAFDDATGTLTFTGSGDMESTGSFSYYPWYYFSDEVTAVVIGDGITNVPQYAFYTYPNLESAALGADVKDLGALAFMECSKLTQINLPNGIETIGHSCFSAAGLMQIEIPDSVTEIGDSAFSETKLTSVSVPGGANMGLGVFLLCRDLKTAELLEGILELPMSTFGGCLALETVYIPGSVTSIDMGVFSQCDSLTSVYFTGDFVTGLADWVFYDLTLTAYYPAGNATWTEDKLQNYGGTITWVPYDACLASGTWGDNITWELGFDGTLIVSGEGKVAENRAEPYPWKEYADQIIKVIFEEGVTNVPVSAFEYSYPNLTSAELKSVEIIESTAFAQCTALTSITLPDTLTEIDNGAFSDAGLTTIDIPEGVTRIGSSAFSFSKLTEIVLPEGLKELGDSVFIECKDMKSAYLPDSITKAGMGLFINCTALETANIPKNLTYVPESMFSGCSSLKAIEIPEGIVASYMDEFAGTALTTVTIPKSLNFLGCAFMNCTKLEEIIFQGDAPVIYDHGFEGVTATAYYPADNATWTEEVMKDYGGDITWVPYGEVEKDYTITWKEAYASLGGNIAVVFKADLSEDLVEDPNAFMRFTYAGKTVDVPVSEASRAGDYYNFFCRITSVNMTDDITAQMMVGEEAIGRNVTTSLEKYCSYIISNSTDTKTVNLMKAMLNYGAAAQKMMNYKTDNLANKSLSDADKVLTKVDATQYKHSITGTEDGIKPVEALLVLGSETTIRVGFQLTGDKSIEEYTFTVDGVEVEPVLKGGKYVLEVPNIAAHRLDEYHTFTCGGITVTYCGLSYVNQVMGYYTEGTTFDMAAALYNYSQATEAYTN